MVARLYCQLSGPITIHTTQAEEKIRKGPGSDFLITFVLL